MARMPTFRPRRRDLDPLDSASVQRWALVTAGQPRLQLEHRQRLGALVLEIASLECAASSFDDDPEQAGVQIEWLPEWRCTPSYVWSEVPIAELGWTLEWSIPDDDAEQLASQAADDEADESTSSIYNAFFGVGAGFEHDEASTSVLLGSTRLHVQDGHVEIAWWDDCDGDDPSAMVQAVQGLTGWALLDESRQIALYEPARCLACCNEFVALAGDEVACPACHCERVETIGAEAEAAELVTPLPHAAAALLEMLVRMELLSVRGDRAPVEAVLVQALTSPAGAGAAWERLLDLSEVDEMFFDARALVAIAEAW